MKHLDEMDMTLLVVKLVLELHRATDCPSCASIAAIKTVAVIITALLEVDDNLEDETTLEEVLQAIREELEDSVALTRQVMGASDEQQNKSSKNKSRFH